jgi:hypothetical protein
MKPGRDIHIYESAGQAVFDDGLGVPEPLFYHKQNDKYGCLREATVRRELYAYFEESNLVQRYQDRGDNLEGCVIPILNTTDVMGLLKGEIEFAPVYKTAVEMNDEDCRISFEFIDNRHNIHREELALLQQRWGKLG